MRKMLYVLVLIIVCIAGFSLGWKADALPPSISPVTGHPLHACKGEDPFAVRRSCYWDAHRLGNKMGHSFDVYHRRSGAIVTDVCVYYWQAGYAATHNFCQHATTVVYVTGDM